ncbi:hypothetical protein GGX14DRAFT_658551 [Mycena pura]|uniref:DUF6533 domain-containing protein n=1 Tax=Mycena pura TaxID=153505 RepID=A0AAD6YMQ2_9AGAR|nr:hypothetical protein GGX14DRAFT_658551 [Mycena pura]
MSSALVAEVSGYRFVNVWDLVPLTILVYDHLLTLDAEIDYMWRKPKRFGFFLFVLLRYISVVATTVIININFRNIPVERCSP